MHVLIFFFDVKGRGSENLVDQYQTRNMSMYIGAYRGSLVGENLIKSMQERPKALRS